MNEETKDTFKTGELPPIVTATEDKPIEKIAVAPKKYKAVIALPHDPAKWKGTPGDILPDEVVKSRLAAKDPFSGINGIEHWLQIGWIEEVV